MSAAVWLRRARRTPAVTFLLAILAAPAAWWRELAAMQRTRTLYTELEELMDEEFSLKQDLKALEVVRHLHGDSEVRAKAVAKTLATERRLTLVQLTRLSVSEEIHRLRQVVAP